MLKVLCIGEKERGPIFLDKEFSKNFELKFTKKYQDCEKTRYDAVVIIASSGVVNALKLRENLLASPSFLDCPIILFEEKYSEEGPVKVLSSKSEYISTNMTPVEISLRIKNQIENYHVKYFSGISLDLEKNKFYAEKTPLDLTDIEFNILRLFFLNGFEVSRKELIDQIWGEGMIVQSNTINTHVMNVKKKIGKYDVTIKAKRGEGYLFERS